MLRRQRVLLALVSCSGGELTSTALVKLAFLARFETSLKRDHTFYDFVPYKYGPFSFSLYRELSTLKQYGYLSPNDHHIVIPRGSETMTREKINELPDPVVREVREITHRYAKLNQSNLLKLVYSKYPWYAVKSELCVIAPSSIPKLRVAAPAVYTAGYEGKSVDLFFRDLLRSGVRVVLDVRANPVSRKYGFAKSSLGEISAKLGIEYQHFPELGIPSNLRRSLTDYASYQRLLDRYKRTVIPNRRVEIAWIASFMEQQPSVLLCMEKDSMCCHRSRLAEAVSGENGLGIVNL